MKKAFCILLFCAASFAAFAIPAKRGAIVRTAADGSQRAVYLHGNEWFHYMTDTEGQWLDESSLLPLSAEAKEARLANAKTIQARRVRQQRDAIGKRNLAPRGLIILVNFSDRQFVTPMDTIHDLINGEHFERHYDYDYDYIRDGQTYHYAGHVDAYGSARQYFIDQSWGQYQPIFDVIGPVDLDSASTFYGRGGNYENIHFMVEEACRLADAQGADFTQYDNNNDGKVDFVYFLFAGFGSADSGVEDYIWPHNWDLSAAGGSCTVDGKSIRNYACSNELQYGSEAYTGIGTFCHEFGHVLGLPDFYPTVELPWGTPHTLNDWDIMDYGCYNNEGNTPPAYSSYERFFMGWLTPRVLSGPEEVSLGKMNADTLALMLCDGDAHNLDGENPNPATFYLLENRDKSGWDAYLPGEGLLITKVQYDAGKWQNNSVNIQSSSMGVDIIEAVENDTDWGAETDTYPAGATAFTEFSGHELTDIAKDEQGIITFHYSGTQGVESVQPSAVSIQKVLRDGRVVIIRNGQEYDLDGKRL